MIGCLGDIVFSVSSGMVKTFKNLKYSGSANFSEHKRHNTVSALEFTGSSPSEISFSITLSYLLGVKVEDELNKIAAYTKSGNILNLIIGNLRYGRHKWVISKYSVSYSLFDKFGKVINAEVSLTLKEYCK